MTRDSEDVAKDCIKRVRERIGPVATFKVRSAMSSQRAGQAQMMTMRGRDRLFHATALKRWRSR